LLPVQVKLKFCMEVEEGMGVRKNLSLFTRLGLLV